MFRFFTTRKWLLWAWLGSFVILSSLWVQVKIDVKINEWFGVFYDMIQKALATPNAITMGEYWASLLSFITLAGMYIALYVAISFFTAHFLFRWRTAMVEWYRPYTTKQEQLKVHLKGYKKTQSKFTRIMEGLGTSFHRINYGIDTVCSIQLGLSGIPIFLWRLAVRINLLLSLDNWWNTVFNWFWLDTKTSRC